MQIMLAKWAVIVYTPMDLSFLSLFCLVHSILLFYVNLCLQMGNKEKSESLNRAIDNMGRKTRDLRRQLRKAVVDHVSDR